MVKSADNIQDKLTALRAEYKKQGVSGFIVPHDDEFQSEYTAPYAERLAFITGFDGSAGHGVILDNKAVVMSDSRYTLQLDKQVDQTHFMLDDYTKTEIGDWLNAHADKNTIIGYDPRLHSATEIEATQELVKDRGITLKPVDINPIDAIWDDQPSRPLAPVTLFPDAVAGESAVDKAERIFQQVKESGGYGSVITMADSVAWLLNIRGGDVDYNPVALSVVLVNAEEEKLEWFIEGKKLSTEVTKHLGALVDVYAPDKIEDRLNALASDAKAAGKTVLVDLDRSSLYYKTVLDQAGADVDAYKDPCVDPRAQKTPSELEAIRAAHIEDGVAMVKFLKWLDEEAGKFQLDEVMVAKQLEAFRKQGTNYLQPSFATISGFAENGAIVHYHATPETSKKIDKDGLLLVDSGGQYTWGTTDITRTVAVGKPSADMRADFTRVLKGHVALSKQKFPKGTTGAQVDVLARSALWNNFQDFGHGTGHGVGAFLNVHEEASNIASSSKTKVLEEGMLLSNEPGFYKAGAYGIRTENLIAVRNTSKKSEGRGLVMYEFETVTFAPYDKTLIDADMLSAEEKAWVDDYHAEVFAKISPHLDEEHKIWLEAATAPL